MFEEENLLTQEEQEKYSKAHQTVLNFFQNPKNYCLERRALILNFQMEAIYPGWIHYAEPSRKNGH